MNNGRPISPPSDDPKVQHRREWERRYREQNRERIREYHRQYRREHRTQMNEAVNRYHRRKKFEVFGLKRGERADVEKQSEG